jgi:hypothetical protein
VNLKLLSFVLQLDQQIAQDCLPEPLKCSVRCIPLANPFSAFEKLNKNITAASVFESLTKHTNVAICNVVWPSNYRQPLFDSACTLGTKFSPSFLIIRAAAPSVLELFVSMLSATVLPLTLRGICTRSCSTRGNLLPHPVCKLAHIPGLDVNSSRTGESTNHAFSGLYTVTSTSSSPFDGVLAVPSHQMAIVDDMLFIRLKLRGC